MSKFEHKQSMLRYYIISVLMVIIGVAVVAKAAYIMTADRDYWTKVASRLKSDSLTRHPQRGNILSTDGELLASSLPRYEIYMDFNTLHTTQNDTLWDEKEDSICEGLNRIFPTIGVNEFRKHLREGKDKVWKDKKGVEHIGSASWQIVKGRISFSDYDEVRRLPIFRMSPYKGGFHAVEQTARTRPYGDLASRTVGEMYGAKDSARSGLELFYDTILRGKDGFYNRRKVLSQYLDITLKDSTNGADIISTIDINIQDLAERSLRAELKEIGGEMGVAIVMECKTGDIKAMTSLRRCADGRYRELQNDAVSAMVEPGSVFKTASIMAAIEDGFIDTARRIDTGGGIWPMYGREMRDHNWRRGGYGTISVKKVLQVSSNIGVSRLIDQYYKNSPEKFIERLRSMGMGIEMDLPFFYDKQGNGIKSKPWIRTPQKNSRGQYTNWAKTTLPWMSIGYETQVPPIFTVSFYNAIANKGRFMQPRFVKEVRKNGEVLQTFEPVCLIDKICSDRTLNLISETLESVVSEGLGKKAGSRSFRVAGKTGTAQIADEHGSYKSGTVRYWLSFCGFFPYDDPRYTCIVCLRKTGTPASGGGMCGPVFKAIAEGVMAQNIKYSIDQAYDEHSIIIPDVKSGNLLAADYVLTHLGIKTNTNWSGSYADGNPIWGSAVRKEREVQLTKGSQDNNPLAGSNDYIPDVIGMGARDAIYLLESRGVKVNLHGRGKVKEQSISPDTRITKGMRINIVLG